MIALDSLSADDIQHAMKLLQRDKEEKASKANFEIEKKTVIEKVYTSLGVPRNDYIRFIEFVQKNTLIWSYNLTMLHEENEIIYNETSECSHREGYDYERLENQEHWHRSKNRGQPLLFREFYHEKHHCFFVNRIEFCPFCAFSKVTDCKEAIGEMIVSKYFLIKDISRHDIEISRNDFFIQPMVFKRCRKHKKTTRVQYLKDIKNHEERLALRDLRKPERSLYDEIYPPPVKYTKAYYAERRVKKIIRRRTITKSEKAFFQMILGASKMKSLTASKTTN